MEICAFEASLESTLPPPHLTQPLEALWWDAKGDWARAHQIVDELETLDGMAVHAYLHRKEGSLGNADYWYRRAGCEYYREDLSDEWTALAEAFLPGVA
jgi:hypothetical protein